MENINKKILEMNSKEGLLVEFDIFFNSKINGCHFVIEDDTELKEIRSIVNNIKYIDKSSSIFCCTYGVNIIDGNPFIYCDNVWVKTTLSIDDINAIFIKYDYEYNPLRPIIPSNITLLSEEEINNTNIKYIVLSDGSIHKYIDSLPTIKFDKFISVYWD